MGSKWLLQRCHERSHTNVSACELHSRVAVHIGQQAQTETLRVGRVCEAVHRQRGL